MLNLLKNPYVIISAEIYFGVFFVFLLFNIIMCKKKLLMQDLFSSFSTGDKVKISLLWPICLLGLLFTIVLWIWVKILTFVVWMLPPYGKREKKMFRYPLSVPRTPIKIPKKEAS